MKLGSAARLFIKEAILSSPSCQRMYSWYMVNRASNHRRGQQLYSALQDLCTVHSQVYDFRLGRCHVAKIAELFRESCYHDGRLAPHGENRFYADFSGSSCAGRLRAQLANVPVDDRVRLRRHRDHDDPARMGNLMILKAPDLATGEKGVIMTTYNDAFAELAAAFRITDLLRHYRLVLEPSYSRNFLPVLFLFAGSDAEVFFASSYAPDHEFIHRVQLNMQSVWLGASDWVDTDLFRPQASERREYDIVIVASWLRLKRHALIFRTLAGLGMRKLRVALIGYSGDMTADDIRRQMRSFGVESQCDVFEKLNPEGVAEIVANSKVALHLSKQEGTNKATYEALCCGTPLIVYRHNIGFPMHAINRQTGILADDKELGVAIAWMVEHYDRLEPRQWALDNTGCIRSTCVLNEQLRNAAAKHREPWTQDIVVRANYVNPRYKRDEDRQAMESAYRDLADYLIC